MSNLEYTINRMVLSLERQAQNHNVSLKGITLKNFNNFLNDLFNDGGEIRCVKFVDLSWNYASDFGRFGSDKFEDAIWRAVEGAVRKLENKYSFLTLEKNEI
ncbi:hypothetical protein [Bacillus cereus group sp. TH152-1LC]|uniref:hypothetical protein n=1 Tax=Bacillus cereus group sp. TH152-1LC TaxID=3018060 RepID=UPI0022E73AA1|nr:hypothetical protein [Bacillus cereus group sp. TH152-1LC]MDA1675399.1 hypothetical protein [Bacillus cereus group sp. TH152-1LC]